MATVKITENILDAQQKVFNINAGSTIEEIIRTHTDGDGYASTFVECYDCETGETYFAPISDENDTASVSVIVNNKDVALDYVVQENDLVTIIFLPLSDMQGGIIGGVVGAIVGAVAGFLYAGIPGLIGGAVAGGIIGFIGGGVAQSLFSSSAGKNGSSDSKEIGQALPDVRGAQNQPLTGNVFPFVMGKVLTTPFIIGSPCNDIYGKHGEEIYIRALYLVGYAPLKITDLKLDEMFVAHNQPWAGNSDLPTIFHGQLRKCVSTDDGNDVGEIVSTWKNNDISIEILQQGQNGESIDWGTIYPYAIIQEDVNANVLYIVDDNLDTGSTPYVSYKGLSLANGLKNNPIKFTRQYPASARIELNVPNGLFKSYSETDDDGNSETLYKKIPVWMGLQWRVVSADNESVSGDYSGEIEGEMDSSSSNYWWDSDNQLPATTTRGWHSFDTISGTALTFSVAASYDLSEPTFDTEKTRQYDNVYNVNNTVSFDESSLSFNVNFSNAVDADVEVKVKYKVEVTQVVRYLHKTWTTQYTTSSYTETTSGEETLTVNQGSSSASLNLRNLTFSCTNKYTKVVNATTNFEVVSYQVKITLGITEGENILIDTTEICNESGTPSTATYYIGEVTKDFNRTVDATTFTVASAVTDREAHSGNSIPACNSSKDVYKGWYGAKAFNFEELCGTNNDEVGLNEFRIVTSVNFEEWARSNFTYSSEEEFIKMFKAYFFSPSNTTKSIEVRAVRISPCYINQPRSTSKKSADTFNDVITWKTLTSEILNDKELEENVIERKRPLSEDDMRKHCVIAIRAKTDRTDQLSDTLKKFSCMAESFSPYYDDTLKQWFPKKVESVVKYYRPTTYDGNTPVRGEEISKTQFITDRQNGIKSQQRKAGNDFTKNIVTNIIRIDNFKDSNGRYYLPTAYDDSYITEVYDGAEHKVWNRNPLRYLVNNTASMLLLTGLGRHMGINALSYDDYDMPSLAKVYNFCERVQDGSVWNSDGYHYNKDGEQVYHRMGDEIDVRYSANAYVYQSVKMEDFMSNLCVAARAVYTRNESNRYTFIVDKPEKYPVALINQANTISSSYTLDYSELPSGFLIPFKDETDGFVENNLYVFRDGETKENHTAPIEPCQFSFVTNPQQVWSLGRYLFANKIMNKEVVVKKVGMEGFSIGLGNLVSVQDDTMLIGTDFGGRITRLIEDDNLIYGFLINNTYEVTGETEQTENILSAPAGFPFTCSVNENVVSFTIPSGSTVSDNLTATPEVTYNDGTTGSSIITFKKVSSVDGVESYIYITASKLFLTENDANGAILRLNYSKGLLSTYEEINSPETSISWYKDGTLISGENGNLYHTFSAGTYEVRVTYDGNTWSDEISVIQVSSSSGYQIVASKKTVFIPVDTSTGLTTRDITANCVISLFINDKKYPFGTVSLERQGVIVMQPGQYKESRVISLPLAPIGTQIAIDDEAFTVKKGTTNVVVLETPISKDGPRIDIENSAVYYYRPQIDNIVGFGKLNEEYSLYRVIKIKRDGKYNYELTLLKYQEDLYNFGRKLPTFQNNISRAIESESYALSNSATPSDLSSAIQQASVITTGKSLAIMTPDGDIFKNGQPSSLTLTAKPTGYTPDTYAWYKDEVLIEGATSQNYSATEEGVYKCIASNSSFSFTGYVTVSSVTDGADGGYQDYIFAVGDFNLTDEQARQLIWYDAPPTVGSGQCLYMATKWIDGD